jgi:hypothetical protein
MNLGAKTPPPRSYLMENSFATIKDTSYFYRIQVSMSFQSYDFSIPIIFLSYESKES